MIPWQWHLGWLGLYVLSVLGIAQWLATRGITDERTRKFVHIGIGNIILPTWLLGVPLWLALAFGIAFSLVTLLSYRFALLGSIGGIERRSWGTFFYALSITLLIAIYWPRGEQVIACLGILVMTWGDALAALVGQYWGRREYKVLGLRKTLEGSLTMAGVSALVSVLLLGTSYGWGLPVLFGALVIGAAAALLETLSVNGLDNLTVPLGSALLAQLLISVLL